MPSPNRFYADLHIHSKYSRACSRDCDLEHLTWWAKRKGVTLVGTGDFTHPAWYEHLRATLVPAGPGLYRLRDEVAAAVDADLPASVAGGTVRFQLSVEISTIYKRDDRTRKVHHLVYLPDLDAVARFNRALGRIGNLAADGRPILGLDSRDLLEITLAASPDGYLVPAHIWTPWFAALGSKSGFDTIADCYADLADHVFAVETGLSSDPAMNWQVSSLDRYALVSNSDAHSPPALAREAHAYTCALDYYAVRDALRTRDGYAGSVEFFPEEGKYHGDGHRACGVRLDPDETRAAGGLCPECGRRVTVGVLSRIAALADRAAGERPAGAAPYRNLVPLPEIVGEIHGVGPKSKTVRREVDALVAGLGAELAILTEVPVDDVGRVGGELLGEAVARLRRGAVHRDPGYDGEYGTIRLFAPAELRRGPGAAALFELDPPAPVAASAAAATATATAQAPAPLGPVPAPLRGFSAPPTVDAGTAGVRGRGTTPATPPSPEWVDGQPPLPVVVPHHGVLDGLDPDQRAAAAAVDGPVLIVAGPGTGKTRTLTHRIAHLVVERDVPPERCLAITFTRRAADELRQRLTGLVGAPADRVTVATFHALALRVLVEQHGPDLRVADEADHAAVLAELGVGAAALAREPEVRDRYVKAMRARDLVELDGLVPWAVETLAADEAVAARYRERWTHLSVDEYQDVDEEQYRLLRLLAPPGASLCVIGDPDQAIYAFRGADVGFFLRFHDDYPGATTVALTRNYRSAPPIIAGAVRAVRSSSLVPDRELVATRRDLGAALLGLHQTAGEGEEAAHVARTIDALVGGASFHSLDSGRVDGRDEEEAPVSFADIAVLYRTSAQAPAVMEALSRAGVPYQRRGHDRLADRPGVAGLVREVPRAGRGPVSERVRRAAATLAERAATPALFDLDDPAHGDVRGVEAWGAAELLGPLAERCGDDVDAFLERVALGAEVDTLDPRADAVSLLTLHAAKGLEFPVVFVVGCVDGVLPLRRPGEDVAVRAARVAEERRLFFVGITRAQRRLFLSAATAAAPPSPFLDALGDDLVAPTGDAVRRRPPARQLRLL